MQAMRAPFVVMALIVAMLNGCARKQEVKEEVSKFPEPRFPSYLKAPQSIDEIMPYARELARNESWRGGLGLGVVNSGESILIVVGAEAEDMIMQAIQRALEERGVKDGYVTEAKGGGPYGEALREFLQYPKIN